MHETLARHSTRLIGRPECFSLDCLPALGKGIDPALAEKAVHAFEYAGQLTRSGIKFVFVGGTAAQLLLAGGISRLSKDVDVIALEGDPEQWRRTIEDIAKRFGDEVYAATEDPRDHGGLDIPAVHFLVSYPTMYRSSAVPDIELDVVFGNPAFPIQQTDLQTRIYQPKEPMTVCTPTVEGLFGGKLSALGPGTLGIPRGKANFDVAVGKQLFDLGHLVYLVRDLGAAAASYRAAYEQQITYHPPDRRPSLESTLDDALYTLKLLSASPSLRPLNPQWAQDLAQLSQSAVRLRGYIGDKEGFDRVGARQAASRVALMLALLRGILLDGLSPEEAGVRWDAHTARIRRDAKSLDAVKAAETRLRPIPWEVRPHIHLKEFVLAAGPEAFLYWDAVFQELRLG